MHIIKASFQSSIFNTSFKDESAIYLIQNEVNLELST